MATETTEPVVDSVPKVNDELAVGEDLEFQRKWWRFENAVWIFFALLILLDLLGVFGRGPLANARAETSDGSMQIQYERVERFSTPSLLTIRFGASAIRDQKVQLWASDSLLKPLANQRVIPAPASSQIGGSGILYTFDASNTPAVVAFALEPSKAGIHDLTFRIPGFQQITLKIVVMT